MKRAELETFLSSLSIPSERISAMADQLEKRARQLSEKRKQSYEETLNYLIHLLKQGWAAKQKSN